VCEELFFRGALQTTLARALRSPHWAILITSVVFSLAHGDIFGFVPRVVMGLALGYLFHYGGSLLVNVCAHFLNNSIIVVFYYLYYRGNFSINPSESIGFPGWLVAATAVLSVVAFALIFVIKRKNSAEKAF
ncbi:MAG: CPBP family intramembrane glutamic endopeptidase, partial [Bacteroidales bacterium]|nr:CPBP family intramembrane glutamic endopeptidase [Bacteroidales bacterium]